MAIHPSAAPPRYVRDGATDHARHLDILPVDVVVPPGSSHLESFPSFARLPAELRLKIWTFALSPRLVSVRCGSNPSSSYSSSESESLPSPSPSTTAATPLGCTSPSPLPPTLHACPESRRHSLHLYRPTFGFARQLGLVLFNPALDVLFLGPRPSRDGFMASHAQFSTCMAMCDPDDLARVRRLAISSDVFCVDGQTACFSFSPCGSLVFDVLAQIATRLPHLDELLFIPHHESALSAAREDGHRLTRQIQAALQAVCYEIPSWVPPPWRVASLDQLSTQMQVDAPDK